MREDKLTGIQNPNILSRKPNLKLCGNHFKSGNRVYRVWTNGTAYRDGKGWYISKKEKS